MSQEILFYEAKGPFWSGPEVLAGEQQAQTFLKGWREDFQRKHGELPAEGLDFKLTRRESEKALAAGATHAAADQGPLEFTSYNRLSRIRTALGLGPGDSMDDLETHVSAQRQALVEIAEMTEDFMGGGEAMSNAIEEVNRLAWAGLRGVRAAGGAR